MTEVEDVARPAGSPTQTVMCTFPNEVGRSQQHGGVEVALDAMLESDPIPALVKRDTPVQRDDVWPRLHDRLQQVGRVGPEMEARNSGRRERVEDRSRVTRDARFVIVTCQSADP